jgi:hypothetical protein
MHYDGNEAYMSRRVTSAKEFCLRLLLMCCSVKEEEWNVLKAEGTTIDVDLTDENDEDEMGEEKTREFGGPVTRSKRGLKTKTACKEKSAGKMEDGKENVMTCGTIGSEEEEEAHERRLAEMSDMLQWEAKCLGVQFLGSEELHRCL